MHNVYRETDGRHNDANSRSYGVAVRSAKKQATSKTEHCCHFADDLG